MSQHILSESSEITDDFLSASVSSQDSYISKSEVYCFLTKGNSSQALNMYARGLS